MTSRLCPPFLASCTKIPWKVSWQSSFKGRQKTQTFSDLVNRMVKKLQPWKTRHVSKAQRVALIQANIESMPVHTMQCFQLPKDTNQQIDKISREFFRMNSNDNK